MNTITVRSLGSAEDAPSKIDNASVLDPIVAHASWQHIVQDAIAAAVVSSVIVALAYLYWAA